jgi:hypothetical protein
MQAVQFPLLLTRDGGRTWIDLGSLSSGIGLNGPRYGNYYMAGRR